MSTKKKGAGPASGETAKVLQGVGADIAADAIADALRKAPNGEGMIPCLARDMVRELKKMGYVIAKASPQSNRRART